MYQKVDPLSAKKRTVFVMTVASVMLAVVICEPVGFLPGKDLHRNTVTKISAKISTSNHFVVATCNRSDDPNFCVSTIEGLIPEWRRHEDPLDVLKLAVQRIIGFVDEKIAEALRLSATPGLEQIALNDCVDLLRFTVDELDQVLSYLQNADFNNPSLSLEASYAQMFLSAALTNQDTCIEGFANTKGSSLKSHMQITVKAISDLLTPCLAICKSISDLAKDHDRVSPAPAPGPATTSRRVLIPGGDNDFNFLPWLSRSERRVLKPSGSEVEVDAVVDQNGTGDFTRISDAVGAAPNNSNTRYVIYVKAGVYREYVEIPTKKIYLTLIGDGINCTIVTGNRSVVDNSTTFHSATFTVKGRGFIARDITFENSAGPEKHQAVALLVASHQSVFYRCSIKGYQDTLYAHSLCQFYRECQIYGTVDFIFGDAAAVFQKC
ncbi:hypothetical protein KI387_010869, partial [Taxus chinensis]